MATKRASNRRSVKAREARAKSTKTTDSKGRVALGARFANKQVIVEEIDDTEVRIVAAAVIPERELWLYRNPKALALVQQGIEDARAGRFSRRPPKIPPLGASSARRKAAK